MRAAWVAANHCHVRVVDVRDLDERVATRISFTEHIPMNRVAHAASAWAPDEPVVFVCRSGRRSARATRTLEDMGFTRVASMTGGMLGWEAEGREVQRERGRRAAEPSPTPSAGVGSLDRSAIEAHFGEPGSLRWVKAAALLMQGTQSCVDGRDRRAVIGTPGGDAGELLLVLAALEAVRGVELDDATVGHVIDAYLDAFGRFYVHTDTNALEGLEGDPRFADAIARQGLRGFVRQPPHGLEADLRAALTQPGHIGCGHLRLTHQFPEEYGVRRELTVTLLGTVLTRLWQGEAIDFVVLEGEHREGAVLNVSIDRAVHPFTRIPTVAPRIDGHAIFVNHPEVSAWQRGENAAFLFEVDDWLGASAERQATFMTVLDQMGDQQLRATLRHLASRLPVYEAHVTREAVHVEGPIR